MKILLVNKFYSPTIGGVESVVRQHAQFLGDEGHQITVLCCSDSRSMRTRLEERDGVKVVRCASFGTYFSMPISPVFIVWLWILSFKSKLVFFHLPFPIATLSALAFPFRRPFIVFWHSDIVQQIVLADDVDHKEQLLRWLLDNETYDKAIVFTNTIVEAARLNGRVRNFGIRAGVLHGDLTQEQRKHIVNLLKNGTLKILIATDVAARGIDIKGIDLVINKDMPRSGDDYIHRTGRTGRAGAEGKAISLVCPTEWNLMASIERYLKTTFEKRQIKGLEGSYSGPKKLKSSGKAAGPKKKKVPKTPAAKKAAAKKASKVKKTTAAKKPKAKPMIIDDGNAPFMRKK